MAVPSPPSDDKQVLRDRMRAVRSSVAACPLPVFPEFVQRLRPGLLVASYRALRGEVDPSPLSRAAAAAGCALALPRVEGRDAPMRFLLWKAGDPLVRGPFGIEQPHADAADVTPNIVLTPLVAFDRRGNRLGQGAGYYDRAFAHLSEAWRVGVAWSFQEALIPVDPWDMPLHAVATEKEWITP